MISFFKICFNFQKPNRLLINSLIFFFWSLVLDFAVYGHVKIRLLYFQSMVAISTTGLNRMAFASYVNKSLPIGKEIILSRSVTLSLSAFCLLYEQSIMT